MKIEFKKFLFVRKILWMSAIYFKVKRFQEISAQELYEILRLRAEV